MALPKSVSRDCLLLTEIPPTLMTRNDERICGSQAVTHSHSKYYLFKENCLQTVSGQTLFSFLNYVVIVLLIEYAHTHSDN